MYCLAKRKGSHGLVEKSVHACRLCVHDCNLYLKITSCACTAHVEHDSLCDVDICVCMCVVLLPDLISDM